MARLICFLFVFLLLLNVSLSQLLFVLPSAPSSSCSWRHCLVPESGEFSQSVEIFFLLWFLFFNVSFCSSSLQQHELRLKLLWSPEGLFFIYLCGKCRFVNLCSSNTAIKLAAAITSFEMRKGKEEKWGERRESKKRRRRVRTEKNRKKERRCRRWRRREFCSRLIRRCHSCIHVFPRF